MIARVKDTHLTSPEDGNNAGAPLLLQGTLPLLDLLYDEKMR